MQKTLIILGLLFLLGCEKEIHNDSEGYEPYVVVNSIISTDSTFLVTLNYSKSIYDTGDFLPIEDASVYIAVKDEDQIRRQEFYLEHIGNGEYVRDNNPTAGQNYELLVEVGDEIITAQTYVPEVVIVDTVYTREIEATENNKKSYSLEVALDINDDNQDYYAWEIETIKPKFTTYDPSVDVGPTSDTDPDGDAIPDDNPDSGETEADADESDNDDEAVSGLRSFGIGNARPTIVNNTGSIVANFTTDGISSKDDPSTPTNEDPTSGSNASEPQTKTKYILRVWAISSDYYHYLLSIQNSNLPSSDFNISGLNSNVKGGSGIFAGYNLAEFELDL